MPRVVAVLLALLFLAVPVSATHYVKEPSFIYEVQYNVLSNGSEVLVPLSVIQFGVTCGMDSCWAEVYGDQEYLLLFNGSQLYLLNFTPALLSNLPPNVPRNISDVYFNGIKYVNGSWYVNVSAFSYSAESQWGTTLGFVFRLDTRNFCVKKVNVNWSPLKGSEFKSEINGWRIEIPRVFLLPSLKNGSTIPSSYPPADFLVAVNASNTGWLPRPFIIVNQTQFPVYFVLKKGNQMKNVTLIFLNTTPVQMWYGYYNENTTGIPGYWFPDDVKIVNVTPCKKVNTSTSTAVGTNGTTYTTKTPPNITKTQTTKEKGICGPGLIVLLTVGVLLKRIRR
ncbi:CGP-CTERM sorting domain-containing protein [Thermococcus aciditolerans]|uniref:CGP-CTERM sorting domain-containing protein n=1 Tax=Thermococcus aciditolerans TaxID=2598455 RepID=A0A5C0SK77_9EURY|nr:CGP-CTERM sorting domain-containing protein [Thermococcus aciditolerans]QEK14905.1 CGP-CTERM sorting domain-containing protein [Thermococcus aciditolerans]